MHTKESTVIDWRLQDRGLQRAMAIGFSLFMVLSAYFTYSRGKWPTTERIGWLALVCVVPAFITGMILNRGQPTWWKVISYYAIFSCVGILASYFSRVSMS